MSTAQNTPNCNWSRVSCAHTARKNGYSGFSSLMSLLPSCFRIHSFEKQVRHCTNSIMVERSWHTGRVWTPKATHVMGTLTTVLQRYCFLFLWHLFMQKCSMRQFTVDNVVTSNPMCCRFNELTNLQSIQTINYNTNEFEGVEVPVCSDRLRWTMLHCMVKALFDS